MLRKLTLPETSVVAIVAIVLVALLASGPTYTKRCNECALCRIVRNDWSGPFGRRWSEIQETDCSRWYRENIEAEHEHEWERSPSTMMTNFWGTPNGAGSSNRPRGVLSIDPDSQIDLYQHIPDVDEAKRLLLTLRDDAESDNPERYRALRARTDILRMWVDSNFAKPWSDIHVGLSRN